MERLIRQEDRGRRECSSQLRPNSKEVEAEAHEAQLEQRREGEIAQPFAPFRVLACSADSVHRASCLHARIEFDLAESAFVIRDVLLQNCGQRLRLLRAKIYPLKVSDFDLIFRGLLHGAKNQKEVPNAHAHLHAVGIGLTIFGSIYKMKIRLLRRSDHKFHSVMGTTGKENGCDLPTISPLPKI